MTAVFNGSSTEKDYIYKQPAQTSAADNASRTDVAGASMVRSGVHILPVSENPETGKWVYTGKEKSAPENLVKTIAKLIDAPATTIADAITAASPAPAAAAAPAYSSTEVSAASGSPYVGAPARKDLLSEMDTSTEIIAEDKPAAATMSSQTILLVAAAVGVAGYWYYYTSSKRR
jgi:hypothetical protein